MRLRVRLEAGRLILSEPRRAYWLGPDRFADDTVALDLALTQAAGAVQPRGAHSLDVQVSRQLARIVQQRRDQDRRYREGRAAGGASAPSRPASGGQPTHWSTGSVRPADANAVERDKAFTRSLTNIYGGEYEQTRHYPPSSPEAQAYIERAERSGDPEQAIANYRARGVKLRPSDARRILKGAPIGSQPIASAFAAVIARAGGPAMATT